MRTAWTWGSLHQLTQYSNGHSTSASYSIDAKAQPVGVTYGTVGSITNTFDDAGRLWKVADWNAATTTFGYDNNNNLTSQVVPSTTHVTDTFGYNAANQMTSISDSNGTTLFSATYTRDSIGQLKSDTSVPSGVSKYKYTTLNQLCYGGSANTAACTAPPTGSFPYTYDNGGNVTKDNGSSQGFNPADQMCWRKSGVATGTCTSPPASSTLYGYDTRGNRTSATPSAGAATCDTYDQASRITKIVTGTTSACTTPTTVGTYAYDGAGLRESKTVGATTTQFLWAGTGGVSPLLQQNNGTTTTSYLYGPSGAPFEQIAGSTTTYLHHDQLGSTRLMTDAAGATATASKLTYDPYGNITSTTGSLTTNLEYCGQYRDSESSLYYLRARYYDPVTTQFLSRDPMVAKTMSPYAYALGSPLNNRDPSGMGVNLPGGLCLKNPFSSDDSCQSTGAIVENATHVCTVFDGNCSAVIPSIGICANASIVGGVGTGGSVCLAEAGSWSSGGVTASGGYHAGLGGGGSVGLEISNAQCIQDYGGPFVEGGGAYGIGSANVQAGVGTHGRTVVVGYAGVGPGTPQGYVGGNNTWVWQWWGGN